MGRAGSERTRRAPVAARVLGAVALAALLASCGSSGGAGSSGADATADEAAVVVPSADCLAPEVLDDLGLILDPSLDPSLGTAAARPAPATPGAIPQDFVPQSVLVCEVGGRMLDGAGTWTAVTATTREGSADELAALVTALGEPAGTSAPCEAGPAVALWLVDAMEQAVRPSVPLDACGAPSPAVLAALDALSVTGQVDRPVELVAPSPDAS